MDAAIRFEDVQCGTARADFALAPGSVCKILAAADDTRNVFTALLLGRKRPDAGAMRVFGNDVYALGEHERILLYRRFGAVAEDGGLISNLKVWENILLPVAYHHGKAAGDVEAEVQAVFRALGISGDAVRNLMSRLPDQLSAYERRVVACARAALMDADVMVFDYLWSGVAREDAGRLAAFSVRQHAQKPGRITIHICPDDPASARVHADFTIHLGE